MAIKQKRDKGLKIMMTETTFNRLNELGELLGQSPSTLASLAVSNLVNQYMGQEKVHSVSRCRDLCSFTDGRRAIARDGN